MAGSAQSKAKGNFACAKLKKEVGNRNFLYRNDLVFELRSERQAGYSYSAEKGPK